MLPDAHPDGSPALDRVAVVVNGRAKQVTGELVETLDQIVQRGDLFVSRSLEEGRLIAHTIVERGYPTVLTGGGDGTFVQMVSWIVAEAKERGLPEPRFGLLKLGTGNALAWVLGAQHQRGVVADLGRLQTEGGSRHMRLIQIEEYLTPFAGVGADAVHLNHFSRIKERLERSKLARRVATSFTSHAVTLLTRTLPQFAFGSILRVRVINRGAPALRLGEDGQPVGTPIERDEPVYEGPARMVAVSTIPYWGFGARMFPYAEEREDRFCLRIANFGSIELLASAPSVWKGTYRSKRLYDFLVDSVEILCDEPTPLEIGGDVVGERQRVMATLAQDPIRVVDYYAPPPV